MTIFSQRMTESINQLCSDKDVGRTALASPGLLMISQNKVDGKILDLIFLSLISMY